MCDFDYKVMKAKYGDKIELYYEDSDYYIDYIKTENVYENTKTMKYKFDTSYYTKDNIYYIPQINKQVLGKMKDECNCKTMKELVEAGNANNDVLGTSAEEVDNAAGTTPEEVDSTVPTSGFDKPETLSPFYIPVFNQARQSLVHVLPVHEFGKVLGHEDEVRCRCYHHDLIQPCAGPLQLYGHVDGFTLVARGQLAVPADNFIYHLGHRLRIASLRIKFFGHIVRRNNDNLDKTILEGKIEGKRPPGKALIRWLDQEFSLVLRTNLEVYPGVLRQVQLLEVLEGWLRQVAFIVDDGPRAV
ncbi:hypothetical protein PR048_007641 [Dryococelus australis]|uniref:Polyprotein n=1 Tax=Dryococelus australis TaxID=614101 RepID=A0ABQ9HUU9_9NEOP|nr:hypothetical protein PR048_007641 [Dryococelus australis]